MFSVNTRVLVLAPHTDDGELGCGATISRMRKLGADIHYVAFCTCDESLPAGFKEGTLASELKEATGRLTIEPSNLHILDFRVRHLSRDRQEVLDEMVRLNRKYQPDIVFCPTLDDVHQDHSTVANEALRAFKSRTILAYEMPWNNINFHANYMIEISEDDLKAKVRALECYESQRNRPYMQQEFVRSLATVRGISIGVNYAEAFTLIRGVNNI